MRFVIIKDKLITQEKCDALTAEFADFIQKNTGRKPKFYIEEHDFTTVPTEADADGDLKPTKAYTTALMDRVHAKYGTYGTDSVVMLVHNKNWIYTGIWGSNWSNVWYTYHVHLVRFDSRNSANSLGTLYHEWMHSVDALIKTHTGFDVNTLFKDVTCYKNWDTSYVHGNRNTDCLNPELKYIRWKDNVTALKAIAPYLRQAYDVRKAMYYQPLTTVQLQVISWLRGLLNKKNGVSPFILK